MITITAGDRFTDIDAYASAIAYAQLFNLKEVEARAVLTGELNYSVPQELRDIQVEYQAEYVPAGDERFVVVDVSDMENMAKFVDIELVHEVIDHHPGMERFWQEKIAERSDIEPIGASCTQIYERWLREGYLGRMNEGVATLLAAGILDNTLNFTAKITNERDHLAYQHLLQIAELPDTWAGQYFSWCQRDIESNLTEAIRTDSKLMGLQGWADGLAIGQIAVWDAEALSSHREEIYASMQVHDRPWIMNILSIRQERNYIFIEDEGLREFIAQVLNISFVEDVAHTDRLWLRKEIMQAAIDMSARDEKY